jgi:hypothetical protein
LLLPEKNGFALQVYIRFSGRQVRTKFADAEASGRDPITSMTASAIHFAGYTFETAGVGTLVDPVGARATCAVAPSKDFSGQPD